MNNRKEAGDRHIHRELRSIHPEEITSYLEHKFYSIRVQYADDAPITIPPDWHGGGKQGEALVKVGDMLTRPISGTKLNSENFIQWMGQNGFVFNKSSKDAVNFMENDTQGISPLIATRNTSEKIKIELQLYHGGSCVEMQNLSRIGNKQSISKEDQENYLQSVRSLFKPFISHGTKDARSRLGLPNRVHILRRVDDCLASGVTVLGDQLIDDNMQVPKERLVEVLEVSVATTQAMVVAITMAELRKVPLIMRIGAPTFGLGHQDNLNYMVNTLPTMKKHGVLAVGDMGKMMDTGESSQAKPQMRSLSDNEDLREVRLFLGGGLPVMRIMQEEYDKNGKPYKWDTSLRRASRVDNGPLEWAVLLSGPHLIVRPNRRDFISLSPGTEIWLNQYGKWKTIDQPGLYVSVGEVNKQLGLQEAFYMDGGVKRTIYLLLPA